MSSLLLFIQLMKGYQSELDNQVYNEMIGHSAHQIASTIQTDVHQILV